jgi:adenosylhomocysteine nucleosidase
MRIGIMGAMAEEVSQLRPHLSEVTTEIRGMREYVSGQLLGKSVTLVFSRWGKVAASSTATTLVERYGVDCLVFTGVAGALDPSLNIGDIVVASRLVQHDMDASALPGIEKYEIPLLGVRSNKHLSGNSCHGWWRWSGNFSLELIGPYSTTDITLMTSST